MWILLVEDDTATANSIELMLRAEGFTCDITEFGEEGLVFGENYAYDLIVLDLMLPDIDGLDVLQRLRGREVDTPILILSGLGDSEHKVKGLGLGADDYLTKPFNAKELITRVENLIEIRRRLRQRFSGEVVVGPSEIVVPSVEAAFVERVRAAVEQQMGNSNFGVEWLADEVGMSVRNLRRRLKAATGLSPGGYVRMMRLERAKQLLAQQAGTVSEIAYQVGFQDPDYFSRLFKQTVGVPPSAYRTKRT